VHIVSTDGRNFRNFEHLISALEPGTEMPADVPESGAGPVLIVMMVRGDPITLRGELAEAMRAHLRAVAVPPPACSPGGDDAPPGDKVVEGHPVPLPPHNPPDDPPLDRRPTAGSTEESLEG
jgi:hypothetical protein